MPIVAAVASREFLFFRRVLSFQGLETDSCLSQNSALDELFSTRDLTMAVCYASLKIIEYEPATMVTVLAFS